MKRKSVLQEFSTIIDWLRYALSESSKHNLHYGHGTDNSWDDFKELILGTLGLPVDSEDIILHAKLSPFERNKLLEKIRKRIIHHIPVPYLTQRAYFCSLIFYVDERVLIPRSPIAELINQNFSPWLKDVDHVLELCTGSGAIAIAIAYAFPDISIDACDISKDALAVAAINCKNHRVENNINLIMSDLWDKIPEKKYDLIIANPPYVGEEEMESLPREYSKEPKLALFAENNGLAIVDKIIKKAQHFLSPQGILIVEVGNSAKALSTLYPNLPFIWLEFDHGGEGVFLLHANQLGIEGYDE